MTATAPIFSKGAFDFALPHALSLAEAGTTVEDKRIGGFISSPAVQQFTPIRLSFLHRDDATGPRDANFAG